MLITPSGIIKNEEIPRIGIVSANSLVSWVFDEIDQGIDLTYEEFLLDLESQGIEPESDAWYREMDRYETDSRTVIFGDWIKNDLGQYVIDRNGRHGYAATYSSDSGNISVEWSTRLTRCNNTSPCYVMADGTGPCGNLNDTKGSLTVIAYDLPSEFYGSD